jgi:hypothetical protein
MAYKRDAKYIMRVLIMYNYIEVAYLFVIVGIYVSPPRITSWFRSGSKTCMYAGASFVYVTERALSRARTITIVRACARINNTNGGETRWRVTSCCFSFSWAVLA